MGVTAVAGNGMAELLQIAFKKLYKWVSETANAREAGLLFAQNELP
jgi:hypothetical protein